MRPVVIAVAITGSVPHKRDNPAVPVLPQEQEILGRQFLSVPA
jgi:3-keto-5-aminohexanoate cleavage enzyme